MITPLIAHGDPVTLLLFLIVQALRGAADNAGPVAAGLLKLGGILVALPLLALAGGLLFGIATLLFVRKTKWLFISVTAEALLLYCVLCAPAGLLLLDDWNPIWAWLTVGLGAALSVLAGLLNSMLLVALVALFSRWTRKRAEPIAPP